MTRLGRAGLILGVALVLSGCGGFRDSRLNPFNWFGRSKAGPDLVSSEAGYLANDPRQLVASVTELVVTPTTGGAIINVVGLPPTQGWWDAELVAENFGDPVDGVMTYRFVVFPPPSATRSSTPQSRQVTAGAFLTDIDLQSISEIVVLAETNSRSSRR
jgi:hypothetical protein